jgi:hypothetical protein
MGELNGRSATAMWGVSWTFFCQRRSQQMSAGLSVEMDPHQTTGVALSHPSRSKGRYLTAGAQPPFQHSPPKMAIVRFVSDLVVSYRSLREQNVVPQPQRRMVQQVIARETRGSQQCHHQPLRQRPVSSQRLGLPSLASEVASEHRGPDAPTPQLRRGGVRGPIPSAAASATRRVAASEPTVPLRERSVDAAQRRQTASRPSPADLFWLPMADWFRPHPWTYAPPQRPTATSDKGGGQG